MKRLISLCLLVAANSVFAQPLHRILKEGEPQGQFDERSFSQQLDAGLKEAGADFSAADIEATRMVAFTVVVRSGKVIEYLLLHLSLSEEARKSAPALLALFVRLPYEGLGKWSLQTKVSDDYRHEIVRTGPRPIKGKEKPESILSFLAFNRAWPRRDESEVEWIALWIGEAGWKLCADSEFSEALFSWKDSGR